MADQTHISEGQFIPFFCRVFPWFAGVQFVLALFLMWQITHRQLPLYVAVSPKGEQMPLVAHTDPSMLPGVLLHWAGMAAVAAYTFDFVNYNKQTEEARTWFTDTGWTDYQTSLKGLIETITARQLFVSSVVSGSPVIANTESSGWTVQLPLLVTYQSSDNRTRSAFLVQMEVIKVPTDHNPSGFGVNTFVMGTMPS